MFNPICSHEQDILDQALLQSIDRLDPPEGEDLDPRAINDLLAALKHNRETVRCAATKVLNRVGPGTRGAAPDLIGAFPVFLDLQLEQPQGSDNLRYLLITRLREAKERWRQLKSDALRERYREFLRQVSGGTATIGFVELSLTNPHFEARLDNHNFKKELARQIYNLTSHGFDGVCFLLDEAEYIVRQSWAGDAWGYLRALKGDPDVPSSLGYVISGYRDIRDYQQSLGSPLANIAEVQWLAPLAEEETRELIAFRSGAEQVTLTQEMAALVVEWAGRHPYLTQQTLNTTTVRQRARSSMIIGVSPAACPPAIGTLNPSESLAGKSPTGSQFLAGF